MISFRFLLFLTVLACLLVPVSGQGKKSKQPVGKGKNCQSNKLSFPCPKGLTIKSAAQSDGVFVGYEKEYEYGVFVFSPAVETAETSLIDTALKNTLASLYAGQLNDYQWKDSDDFTDDSKWSKYEVSKSGRVGFNKNLRQTVHLQFVRLSFNQKDLIAGFVYELAKGEKAEEEYENWSGGGNAPASYKLQNIVNSITGEKKSGNTPGGPPAMVVPKSN